MAGTVCQHCGENPATIHFTDIKDDARVELHVCEECAAAQGITNDSGPPSGGLTGMVASVARAAAASSLACPHCGLTWREFRKRGRLGCPHDYEIFEAQLVPLLANMHRGAERHVGRLPRGHGPESSRRGERLMDLRRRLSDAVEAERYEQAARLRDEIRAVEEEAPNEGSVPEESGKGPPG